jgi:hypothetical protein
MSAQQCRPDTAAAIAGVAAHTYDDEAIERAASERGVEVRG